MIRGIRSLAPVAMFVLVIGVTASSGQEIVKKVDCDKGQTITHTLDVADGNGLTLEIVGMCNESPYRQE